MDPDLSLDFEKLLEESFSEIEDVSRGALLTGTIQSLDETGIVINLGLKRDGIVPRFESSAIVSSRHHRIGDEVNVIVLNPEDRDGSLIVSIKEAEALNSWVEAEKQIQAGNLHEGRVLDANKGGLIIEYHDLHGFIPSSHLTHFLPSSDETRRLEALRAYVGTPLTVKFIEVDRHRKRLIFSEKDADSMRRSSERERFIDSISVGDVLRGRVRNTRDFGAFIDIGGMDGLVHISEMAWVRLNHPDDVVRVGEEIEVKVISIDPVKKQIGLSIKQLTPNPWKQILDCCGLGQCIDGIITRTTDYGVFVEIMNGIEALLHLSEMADAGDLASLHIGDPIQAYVVHFEPERQRIGLSTRRKE